MAFRPSRIVSYGCSYTAGQELGDAIILNKTHEEIDAYKRKHGLHCVEDVYGDEQTRARCTSLSSKLAWPNYVASKFGIPCVNRAVMGTSVNEAIYNLERDLATGNIEEQDLILVGLTSPTRFSWVMDSGKMATKFIGDTRWADNAKFNDLLVGTWATDNNLMWEYWKHARYLNLLSSKLGGRLKTVMAVHNLPFMKISFPKYKRHLAWIDSLDLDHLLCPSESLSSFIEEGKLEEQTHGWLHPKVEVHQRFASHIYDQLIAAGVVHD